MLRILAFLLALHRRKYWGSVTIEYQGEGFGRIHANETYKEETLPILDADIAAAQRLVESPQSVHGPDLTPRLAGGRTRRP